MAVPMIDTATDPKHPSLLEKKANIGWLFFGSGRRGHGGDEGLGEFRIGCDLFAERLRESLQGFGLSESLREVTRTGVGRDLIMFNPARRADEQQVLHFRRGFLIDGLLAFLDESSSGLAFFPRRFDAELFADALDALDVLLGLLQVKLKAFLQVGRGCCLGHLGQGLGDLRFGAV